jgi:uroporphyrinogen-III synthase
MYNRRILITAPRNYAARLSQQLIAKGGLPFVMPTIEICPLTDFTLLDTALQHLENFDWIAFTSRNGIEGLVNRMQTLELPLSQLNGCKICAIGKDAERLIQFGIQVNLLPREPSPAGIIAELSEIPEIDRQRILVPVPQFIGVPEPDVVPNFLAGLQQLGMEIIRVPAYLTRSLSRDLYIVELNLIRQGKIDAIAFSSTAEVSSFLQMLDVPPAEIDCPIACFGPYTAANAKQLGLKVAIVSEDFSSFAGFADAIAAFFQGK